MAVCIYVTANMDNQLDDGPLFFHHHHHHQKKGGRDRERVPPFFIDDDVICVKSVSITPPCKIRSIKLLQKKFLTPY